MAPENGMIDCSLGDDGVPTDGDTCTVTCNDGFVLRGDATRTCRINRRGRNWSGNEARCEEGMQQTVSTTYGAIIYHLNIKDIYIMGYSY